MKKILAAALVLILAISVLGCSSGDNTGGTSSDFNGGSKIDTMKRIEENNQIIWGRTLSFRLLR